MSLYNLNGIPGQLGHLLRRPPGRLAELYARGPKCMEWSGANTGLLTQGIEPVVCLPVLKGEEGVLPFRDCLDQHPDLLLQARTEWDNPHPVTFLLFKIGDLMIGKIDIRNPDPDQVTQSAGVACRASVQVPAALLIVAGSEALALLV